MPREQKQWQTLAQIDADLMDRADTGEDCM